MAGVAENLNVCVTLTLEKPATKVVRRRKRFSIERLSNDYQTTIARLSNDFPLHRGNFILTATVCMHDE